MSLRMEVNVLRSCTDRVHSYHEDVVYVRHHMKGWKGARDKASVSNLARKRLAYEGAILVPIAVPLWLFG